MDINSYQRIFVFGCSFTKYKWFTWADAIEHSTTAEFYNLAVPGSCNMHIATTVSQAARKYIFSKRDLVIVMWTSIARESRVQADATWLTSGSVASAYPAQYVKQYSSDMHYVLRDTMYYDLVNSAYSVVNLSMVDNATFIRDGYTGAIDPVASTLISQHALSRTVSIGSFRQEYAVIDQLVIKKTKDYHPAPLIALKFAEYCFDFTASSTSRELAHTQQQQIIRTGKCEYLRR